MIRENKFSLGSSIKSKVKEYEKEEGIIAKVISVRTSDISNWEFRDRNDFELGDIENLSKDIEKNGQVQPIVITLQNNIFKGNELDRKYIVIAGYRRWLACGLLGVGVECILKDCITLESALATLVSENKKESISDYSKGVFYNSILEKTTITQNQLADKLGLKPTTLKNFLSFSRINNNLWKVINNPSLISSRTAAYLASLCAKGDKYVNLLLVHADKIENGVGVTKLSKIIDKSINVKPNIKVKKQRIIFENKFSSIKQNGHELTIHHNNLNDDLILMIKELVEMHSVK